MRLTMGMPAWARVLSCSYHESSSSAWLPCWRLRIASSKARLSNSSGVALNEDGRKLSGSRIKFVVLMPSHDPSPTLAKRSGAPQTYWTPSKISMSTVSRSLHMWHIIEPGTPCHDLIPIMTIPFWNGPKKSSRGNFHACTSQAMCSAQKRVQASTDLGVLRPPRASSFSPSCDWKVLRKSFQSCRLSCSSFAQSGAYFLCKSKYSFLTCQIQTTWLDILKVCLWYQIAYPAQISWSSRYQLKTGIELSNVIWWSGTFCSRIKTSSILWELFWGT